MKTFLKIVGILILVLVLFLTVTPAFLGPPSWAVTVSRTVDAPAAEVYAKVSRLPEWSEWTNWEGLEFSGPEQGAGAKLTWNSAGSNGELTITEAEADSRLAYHITMEQGAGTSDGTISFEAEEDGTKVTWQDSGYFLVEGQKVEGGAYGYFLRFAGSAMRMTLKRGLADNLDGLAQSLTKQ